MRNLASLAALALFLSSAHASPPAPPFDVAYHAWEIVTGLARNDHEPELAGECRKTFRPFVIPALRRQTRQEQDAAANACVGAARQACVEPDLRRTPEIDGKCREFRSNH